MTNDAGAGRTDGPAAPPEAIEDAAARAVAYAHMVERITDGFVALDRDWRYVYVNARAGAMFGREPASLVGRVIWDEFPEGVGRPFHLAYEEAMRTQQTVRFEDYYAPWDRWFENRVYPSPDGVSIFFTEITDRRLAEEALRQSEARFRMVAAAGPAMLFEWDIHSGRVWRAGGLLASLGYGPESDAESFEWWMERIHPDDRPAVAALSAALLAGDVADDEADFAYRFRRPDGSYADLIGHNRLVRDAARRPVKTMGVVSDVQERRRIEGALRQSEARFRAFVEQASDAVMVLDVDGTFRYVSPSMTRMLGYEPDELLGRSVFDLVHPDDRADAAATLARGLRAPGEPMRVEVRARHRDGSWRVTEAVGRPLDGDGATSGVLIHMRDFGEHSAAERALRESEALFRSLSDSAPVGIFQSDLAGAATYVNPRLQQIVGLTEAEMMGHGWASRVHPDDRDELWAKWSAALATASEFEHEYRFVLPPDGAIRWVQARATPVLDASGAPTGTVGTIVDLTERRRLEQQLLHSQKLEAVGQLSGGVAHDFNNILTVIQANVDMARADAVDPDVRAALEEASAAAHRAAQLTRQLLAFSRRQVLQPRALDLNDAVVNAERLLRRLIGERIVVEAVLAPDLWAVRADAGQVEQVLINLALNARDAMPDGGTLTIETSNMRGDPRTGSRDAVRVRVRDTGIGMDEPTRARVFEPFFTTKPPGDGTGLGLAMVYGIVAQSEGTVHVESALGAGSVFTVLLPRAAAAAGATVPAPQAKVQAGGLERILLVEDEASVRGVARRILERAGYTVLEAQHGADALLVWHEHGGAVDLLLTDVRMPEMGGPELVLALRRDRPDLPAVVMSGYADADAGAPGRDEYFLEKPFSRETLLRCVRRALDESPGGPG